MVNFEETIDSSSSKPEAHTFQNSCMSNALLSEVSSDKIITVNLTSEIVETLKNKQKHRPNSDE